MTRPAVIPRQIDLEHLQASDRYGAYAVIRNLLPLLMLLALAPILATRSIATAWSPAPLVGLFLYRITIVMHDCVHRTLFRRPRVNDWIGLLLGAVTGIDLRRFRALHGKHHRQYGRAEDPQGFHYLGVQRLNRVQFAWHLVKPLFGANLRYVLAREHAPSRKLVARHASRRCRGLPVGAVSDVHCRDRRWAISPSRSLAVRIRSNFRSVSQPASRPGRTRLTNAVDQAGYVRSHSTRALERLLLYDLHFNYHSAHHRWPQCPSCHLPLVHEQYLAGHVPLATSMLATVVAIRAGDRS